jgi:hypothetical protein
MNDTYETGIDQDQEDLQYHGWPGDGSGEDDLADYNQLEADDYRNEEDDKDLGEYCDDGDFLYEE